MAREAGPVRKREREKLAKGLAKITDAVKKERNLQVRDTYKRELELIKSNLNRYWNRKKQ